MNLPEFNNSCVFFSSEFWAGHETFIVQFLKDNLDKNINIQYIQTEKKSSGKNKDYTYGIVTTNSNQIRNANVLHQLLTKNKFFVYNGFVTSSTKSSGSKYSSEEMIAEYFNEMRNMHLKPISEKNITITGKLRGGYDDKIMATYVNIELRNIYLLTPKYEDFRKTDNSSLFNLK